MAGPPDFSEATKRKLVKRAGEMCSRPCSLFDALRSRWHDLYLNAAVKRVSLCDRRTYRGAAG